jgi:hypothetical protein
MNSLAIAGNARERTVSSIPRINTARHRKDRAIQGLL